MEAAQVAPPDNVSKFPYDRYMGIDIIGIDLDDTIIPWKQLEMRDRPGGPILKKMVNYGTQLQEDTMSEEDLIRETKQIHEKTGTLKIIKKILENNPRANKYILSFNPNKVEVIKRCVVQILELDIDVMNLISLGKDLEGFDLGGETEDIVEYGEKFGKEEFFDILKKGRGQELKTLLIDDSERNLIKHREKGGLCLKVNEETGIVELEPMRPSPRVETSRLRDSPPSVGSADSTAGGFGGMRLFDSGKSSAQSMRPLPSFGSDDSDDSVERELFKSPDPVNKKPKIG